MVRHTMTRYGTFLICFLASDLAGYISGNWIGVDGGKHKSLF